MAEFGLEAVVIPPSEIRARKAEQEEAEAAAGIPAAAEAAEEAPQAPTDEELDEVIAVIPRRKPAYRSPELKALLKKRSPEDSELLQGILGVVLICRWHEERLKKLAALSPEEMERLLSLLNPKAKEQFKRIVSFLALELPIPCAWVE